ncbi:hypothetical protein JCM11641_000353 [Rhodosporidiobolus odoratus]
MAQAAIASPLPLHLHDSSLTSALGLRGSLPGSHESSPWSKFLSPSLFALDPGQRSSPLPVVAAPPSPLKQSQNHPSLFTHAREINPFEQSFSRPLPYNSMGTGSGAGAGGGTEFSLHLPPGGRPKRKRALSSPALLTPGGSQGDKLGESIKEAFLHQAKRPSLRFGVQSGLPGHMASTMSLVPSESTMSFSSGTNSFDEATANSSLSHRHRRHASHRTYSLSPDTSVAPSPASPKQASPYQPSVSTFNHFQPEPAPFSLPPSLPPAPAPLAHPAMFGATLAPAQCATVTATPLPPAPYPSMNAQAMNALSSHIAVDPNFSFPPPLDPFTVQPPSLYASATMPLSTVPLPAAGVSSNLAAPGSAVNAGFPFQQPLAMLLPTAMPGMVPQQIPIPPVASPSSGPQPIAPKQPCAPPAMQKTASGPSGPIASTSTDGAKPKPPGKKRGRKPKNWDPTLERPIELDPQEQEEQRKQALERNRVAASKSRRRKKEKVELLETASTELCNRNISLQAECRALLAEVHSLRTFLGQSHPPGCSCMHVQGYLAREADGGGIPAILYGAGATLERDYTKMPRWGQEDCCMSGMVEERALDALNGTGHLGDVPGLEGIKGPQGRGKKAKNATTTQSEGSVGAGQTPSPVVGSIPLVPTSGEKKARTSEDLLVVNEEESSEEDEPEESEEEIELKSRRARGIATKSK